uniref:Uncharacterized protein n=1 Tax=Eutreptiella gymnastica TaxID=73025 RepID=A0A7S4FFY3_9EUGL
MHMGWRGSSPFPNTVAQSHQRYGPKLVLPAFSLGLGPARAKLYRTGMPFALLHPQLQRNGFVQNRKSNEEETQKSPSRGSVIPLLTTVSARRGILKDMFPSVFH